MHAIHKLCTNILKGGGKVNSIISVALLLAQGLAFGMIAIANCTPSIGQYLIHMVRLSDSSVVDQVGGDLPIE